MTATETLQAAREKIEATEDWCRGEFARDKVGKKCDPTESKAATWCAIGAILHVTGWDSVVGHNAKITLSEASLELFGRETESINDDGTHKQVMCMYDVAIQKTRGSESRGR